MNEIQVIKDRHKYRYVNCNWCNSELKILKSIIKTNTNDGCDTFKFICPCCKKTIEIDVEFDYLSDRMSNFYR